MSLESREIRVAIADDHLLILNGLENMLQSCDGFAVALTALNGNALLSALTNTQIDVLLLDIELPDINGVDLCKMVCTNFPNIKVIALTNHDEVFLVRKMMRNGAAGYLLKGTDKESLLNAIEEVFNGGQYLDKKLQNSILQQSVFGKKTNTIVQLTKRENEILALIAQEYANQEIADKLFLSVRTVESHRLSLCQKLNVKNTVGLVKEAYLRGLV